MQFVAGNIELNNFSYVPFRIVVSNLRGSKDNKKKEIFALV